MSQVRVVEAWGRLMALKRRAAAVTLCDECAGRLIAGWVGLIACARGRRYRDGAVEEYVEPRVCETCGREGFHFTYVLPEWRGRSHEQRG
ncbi:MAG: hypothetical protein QXT30_03720 [Candidatus Bathyarchaeia archaeon]